MLKDNSNLNLISEWLQVIRLKECREAFLYLAGIGASSKKLSCYPAWKGYLRDFRFCNSEGQMLYAFVTNQKWLLFYFSAAVLRNNSTLSARIRKKFPDYLERKSGEYKVKIRTVEDVKILLELIQV
mgnify:CR=1 FL=1|tara:strand:+ start:109 stop:489 length:381 start_codon:yes stop_codon:yes gene_type:complete